MKTTAIILLALVMFPFTIKAENIDYPTPQTLCKGFQYNQFSKMVLDSSDKEFWLQLMSFSYKDQAATFQALASHCASQIYGQASTSGRSQMATIFTCRYNDKANAQKAQAFLEKTWNHTKGHQVVLWDISESGKQIYNVHWIGPNRVTAECVKELAERMKVAGKNSCPTCSKI